MKLLVVALLALTVPAAAQAKTVYLYGDSWVKGYAFGQYNYPSPLERIDTIANLIGTVEVQNQQAQDFTVICSDVSSGNIQPGDDIVWENAGPHFGNTTTYQQWLSLVIWCSTHNGNKKTRQAKNLILTTTFDHNPGLADSQYNVPLPKISVNQETRLVAARTGAGLLDWSQALAAAYDKLEPLGVHVIRPQDGIHPTVWGNIVLAVALERYEGSPIINTDQLVAELMAQEQVMVDDQMNPPFTQDQARQWVQTILDTSNRKARRKLHSSPAG